MVVDFGKALQSNAWSARLVSPTRGPMAPPSHSI